MAPSAQPIAEDESVNKTRQDFLNMLKDTVTEKALETIPADPDMKNIPKNITTMLETENSSLLTVPQSQYACMTEEPLPIKSSDASDPLSLWIGFGGDIPRWKKGQVVQFAVLAGGYPTPNHAVYSAYKLNQAVTEWNNLQVGVSFKWVTKLEDAAFVLAYGGDQGSVLARGFFPNAKDLNALFVYQSAFREKTSPYQNHIFLHELGHILGLRHEFAAQEGGAVQFGPSNPLSVMGYTFPPNIQPSDIVSTKAFYDLKEATIGGLRVVDWTPDN